MEPTSIINTLFWTVLGAYIAGSLLPLLAIRNYRLGLIASLVPCVFASILQIIMAGFGIIYHVSKLPLGLHLDWFSAIYVIIVGLAGLATSIYGLEYMDIYRGLGGSWLYGILFTGFTASMTFIPLTRNLAVLVFLWEIMTITSALLISWEYVEDSVEKASKQYMYAMLLLSSIPIILGACLAWFAAGTLNMSALSMTPWNSSPLLQASILLLYLGFTAKMGLFPLHFWLPDAHPAAPSNVSGLLSGVMIKMGVYGVVAVVCNALHAPTWIYYLMLGQAIMSIFWGSVKALGETDAKRLLAYSSVSQIGYIATPVALAMIMGIHSAVGELLLVAGTFYLFAHSLFKTLLFLTSGSLLYLKGTRSLNDLAGTARASTLLVVAILIGGISLAGLPPLLGFISKIIAYGSMLATHSPATIIGVVAVLALSPLSIMYSFKYMAYPLMNGYEKPEKHIGPLMKIGLLVPVAALVILCFYPFILRIFPIAPDPLMISIPTYTYYLPLIVSTALLVALLIGIGDSGKAAAEEGVWTTGYRVPLYRHRIRPEHLYREITSGLEPMTRFFHEVYECIVWWIPGKIGSSGLAIHVAGWFGKLNKWFEDKLVSCSEKIQSLGEYRVDEAIGSLFLSLYRAVRSIVRIVVVSPIALLSIALFFLAIIIIVFMIIAGVAP